MNNNRFEKRLLDINDLAIYLHISKNTLYNWLYRRKIPHIKVGRSVRFDLKDIEKWINEKRVEKYRYKGIL
jgi:excisionase family DNA binding protein